jgi:hypothetical protein
VKESKYVKMARTRLQILKHSRIPLYLHRKSNHIYTVWQHVILLAIRQYEGKSYRMFADWLIEAYYLRMFIHLSKIPHFTTLQKFADRITGTMLESMISNFILLINIKQILVQMQPDSNQPMRHNTTPTELNYEGNGLNSPLEQTC